MIYYVNYWPEFRRTCNFAIQKNVKYTSCSHEDIILYIFKKSMKIYKKNMNIFKNQTIRLYNSRIIFSYICILSELIIP